jgi:glutathione S-transferase
VADYTFYFNPMSRAQIARWALHEVGADYDSVLVPYGPDKPAGFLQANPMGKIPTLVHHVDGADRVVTEAAAICHYLAVLHPDAGLLPRDAEVADYFRWLLFAAGPVEQAVTNNALGWVPNEEQEASVGFGSFERTIDTLAGWFADHDYVCGARFTMADVYVGSAVDWGQAFKSMPARDSLVAYAERVRQRPAYQAAKAIDNGLIADMQASGS